MASKKTLIILDPGHGGRDPGATWKQSDGSVICERDKNLAIANQVKWYLETHGNYAIGMTRDENKIPCSIQDRIDITKSIRDDVVNDGFTCIFVSIHCNAPKDHSPASLKANGTEILIHSVHQDLCRELTTAISESWKADLPDMKWRGFKLVKGKDPGAGLLNGVAKLGVPCCLVECGFITNEHDRGIICSSEGQFRMGRAIARGIIQYIGA